MTRPRITTRKSAAYLQRGAALVTSLLLLLVLTIVGITTMQMSRMQERMTGNSRDLNIAFQGAEAAARSGESFIRAQTVEPITCSETPCTVWMPGQVGDPAIAETKGRSELQADSWWKENAKVGDELTDTADDPQYLIEEVAFVRTDGGVVLGEEDGRNFYQVSGRSTGASGLAEVVVQTTFTRRF